MYSAPKGTKSYHQQYLQQRSHATNKNNAFFRHKKRRVRNLAFTLILCLCFAWIYVTTVFVRHIPNSNIGSNDLHSVAQFQRLRIGSYNKNKQSVTKSLNTNQHKVHRDSPYTIVHSLTTRFMLGQKGQPFLARARYLLFETFCQPTVRFQTALVASSGHEFSWFVLADPGLDQDILDDLETLLSKENFPRENAYLVLTDNASWAADGVGVPGVTSYGAGFEDIARAVRDGDVQLLTGDAERLTHTLEKDIEATVNSNDETKPLLLIETMLDADDGLNNQAMEWIQDLAISHTQLQQNVENSKNTIISPTLNSTWWLLCGTDHIEWHNRDVYRLTDKQYESKGLGAGIIGLRHAPQYCASAGFTRVGLTKEKSSPTGPTLAFPEIAYSNHALATEEFDRCSGGSKDGIRTKKSSNNSTDLWSHCFRRDFEGSPFVLKGRTVTSDSMDHMSLKNEDYRDLPWETKDEHPLLGLDDPDKMWGIAIHDFSIDRQAAQTTSIYLREHLESILQENKSSRCAPGFPCREVANVAFKKMTKYVDKLQRINQREAQKQDNQQVS